ncbi:hypothetical protein JCM10207_007363 [Rhodosporidiobolus poonsookiae]
MSAVFESQLPCERAPFYTWRATCWYFEFVLFGLPSSSPVDPSATQAAPATFNKTKSWEEVVWPLWFLFLLIKTLASWLNFTNTRPYGLPRFNGRGERWKLASGVVVLFFAGVYCVFFHVGIPAVLCETLLIPNFAFALAHAVELDRIVTQHSCSSHAFDALTHEYTALLAANPNQADLVSLTADQLSVPWWDLLDETPWILSRYAERCQLVENNSAFSKNMTPSDKVVAATLKSVLAAFKAHFKHFPGVYDPPFVSPVDTTRAYCFTKFDFRLAPFDSSHPAHALESALQLFVNESQRFGIESLTAIKLLAMHLKYLDASWEVDRAERSMDDAILDAVLEWKARKLELERLRRSKQD